MSIQGAGREVEIKLRVTDADAARRLLRDAGFRVARRRTLERDVVYDTPEGSLRKASRLLRVRSRGPMTVLTYKGSPRAGRHKDREEIELSISDGRALELILRRLGMQPSFRYEKFRTVFNRSGAEGAAVVDETPIGVFVELEGPPDWIDRTARDLHFSEADYITASYARLYFETAGSGPEVPAEMLFGASKE